MLWIRSQNKLELIKVGELSVCHDTSEKWGLYTSENNSKSDYPIKLGEYKSKERCIEILDEIQNLLSPKLFKKGTDIMVKDLENKVHIVPNLDSEIELLETNNIVYEMPKE